ncbi:MAG: tetratricopeptide repeat protein [Planctomycetota bacterium]|nr:tetratricopeptide repeat protein [Planctomycetota bacterium]
MRLLKLALVGVVLLAITVSVVWFTQPKAQVVEVDTSQVSEEEGARKVIHALDVDPRTLEAARELWETEDLQAARDRLEGALPGGADEGALRLLLSVVCRRLGDAEAALEHGLRGVELWPTSGDAHYVYARAIALQMMTGGRISAMRNIGPWRKELRTAIELDPTNVDARSDEFLFFAYVPGLGDVKHALTLADEVIPYDPIVGVSFRARALARLDRKEEALAEMQAALSTHPGNPKLLLALGQIHEAEKDWRQADEAYARLEEPTDLDGWRILYQRARMRTTEGQLQGEAEAALGWLDAFLAASPRAEMMAGPADVHHRRGLALELLDRPQDARAAYQAALELDPDHKNATKALEALPR